MRVDELRSIDTGIIDSLFFQDRADVSLVVQNANNHGDVLMYQIINTKLIEAFYRPSAKADECWIANVLQRTRLRSRQH